MRRLTILSTLLAAVALAGACGDPDVRDDAALLGLTPADFPQLEADVFAEMDGGLALTPEAIQGRNTWILWTGGSQVFIDWLAREGYGISDTLRMLDSRLRSRRFGEFGLVNEPGFAAATEPDEHGLWLDVPADGAERGRVDAAIAAEGIDPRVYGRSTGVMGLRLFPNPEWDDEARRRWDPERFYNDLQYSKDPELVRPYRVGMTCGLCHVAPHPLRPPADPDAPGWENLASALGNQYFREGRVFATNLRPPAPGERSSFLWEMLDAQPPGTSDTSRMATDHINNPNAINGIFNLGARLAVAERSGALETMSAATMHIPGDLPNPRFVPHVLKDGADSVGVPGATIRVYVNIGMYSQYWLKLHKPLVGVTAQKPFQVETAQRNSVYWRATEERLANLAAFLGSIGPMPLAEARWTDADGVERSGAELLAEPEVLERGARAFARNCAGCHSSKRPPAELDPRSEEGKAWFEGSVLAADFRDGNFLSEEVRHWVDKIGTNACRSLATNAVRGHVWDNFSSETYKGLPAVEKITTFNPITGRDDHVHDLRSRGVEHAVGYYRTPSLIAVWSSAPLLHNNSLGAYTGDPSVEGRLAAFEDAAGRLLWPERRLGPGSIWRTRHESELAVPLSRLPGILRKLLRQTKKELLERRGEQDYLVLGPIPRGTSINLLGSLDLGLTGLEDLEKAKSLVHLAGEIREALEHLRESRLDEAATFEYLKEKLVPSLLANSKCPDLVADRGHLFGTDLPDGDKLALVEFLKTL